MNFKKYLQKTIKEIDPEMDISPEGFEAIQKTVDNETNEIAKLILEHRQHKTIMAKDVDFALMFHKKYGYAPW